MNKISTLRDLRNDLIATYEEFKKGEIGHKTAKEISNMAGKIIQASKLELEYKCNKDKVGKMDFFELNEQ